MSETEYTQKEIQKILDYIEYLRKNPPITIQQFKFYRSIDISDVTLQNNNLSQLPPSDHDIAIVVELQRFYIDEKVLEGVREQLMKSKALHTLSNYGYYQNIGLLFQINAMQYREKENDKYYIVRINEFINVRFFTFISVSLMFLVSREEMQEEEIEQEQENYEIDDDLDT